MTEYLNEENKIFSEQLKGRRLSLTDDQRRRLTVKGKALVGKVLNELTSFVMPDAIMRY